MLIDSNILIYAINIDSQKHLKAQQFLEENSGNLEISHQNILETLRVLTHKRFSNPMEIKDAISAIQAIAEFCRIITPTPTTYYLSLELITGYRLTGNRIFDAYLAATALSNGVGVIATDNIKDFQKFAPLKIINPFT